MKDYTVNEEQKRDFILNYDIEGDKIIIEYASGKKYENFYTKELEKDILNRMKEQVLCGTDFLSTKRKSLALYWGLCVVVSSLIFIASIINIGFLMYGILGIIAICVGNKISVDILINKQIRDYEKNLLFVENMELFQNGFNQDMGKYLNLKKKDKKTIDSLIAKSEQQKNVLEADAILKEPTLNTIDQINPSTIDELYDLLMRNEEFSKYYKDNNVKKRTLKK